MQNTFKNKINLSIVIIVFIIVSGVSVFAVPPHPDMLKNNVGKATPYYLANHELGKKVGLDAPSTADVLDAVLNPDKNTNGGKATASGNFNVLAILVQFSDNASSTVGTYYDSLLFSVAGNTVRDYFSNISYATLDLVTVNMPSENGWLTAPQNYSYYVNGENGTGYTSYPNNCQKLAEDLVAMVDPVVDFSNYDNDNDGYVDAVIIIHAGPGAEVTSSNDDIWSHKWNTSTPQLTGDGVFAYEYTIQPEYISTSGDMTIGVFCHELGHAFGLPDLYDTDGSSYGIGKWGIMAYGSWGGVNGNLPTNPCAWSRIQMGFASATNITSNVTSRAIPDVKVAGEILRLWTSGAASDEYFLVENRQKIGYDGDIPGNGLLIWHIDEGKETSDNTDNTEEWWPGLNNAEHYRVALEQADGLFEIEHSNDLGDANDAFRNGQEFNALSSTTSDSYSAGTSFVSVENISAPSGTMYADLTVALASSIENNGDDLLPNSAELYQNYPNPFNPSTSIDFYIPVSGNVSLIIYNILGNEVKVILENRLEAGSHSYIWDGTNGSDDEVSTGIYFYKLVYNNETEIKKMMLIK